MHLPILFASTSCYAQVVQYASLLEDLSVLATVPGNMLATVVQVSSDGSILDFGRFPATEFSVLLRIHIVVGVS